MMSDEQPTTRRTFLRSLLLSVGAGVAACLPALAGCKRAQEGIQGEPLHLEANLTDVSHRFVNLDFQIDRERFMPSEAAFVGAIRVGYVNHAFDGQQNRIPEGVKLPNRADLYAVYSKEAFLSDAPPDLSSLRVR
jgi:hypothetical protein